MTDIKLDPMRVTCREAATRGLSRFYTGLACKAGHIAERFVTNRQCVECNARDARRWEWKRSIQDPSYRMYRNLQRRTGQALRGLVSPVQVIGCDRLKLKNFMQDRFRKGMCWEKYGQWEVDHIVPLSAASSFHELIALCHFTNLQPLWRQENLRKGGA